MFCRSLGVHSVAATVAMDFKMVKLGCRVYFYQPPQTGTVGRHAKKLSVFGDQWLLKRCQQYLHIIAELPILNYSLEFVVFM